MMAQTMIIASREQQQVPRASTTTGSSSKYSNSSSSSTSGDSAFWKFKILQLGLLDAALETTSTQSNDSNERVLSSKGGSMCRRLPMASQTTTGSAGEDDDDCGGVAMIEPEPMRSYWSWRCKQVQQMDDEIKSDPRYSEANNLYQRSFPCAHE